MQEEINLEIGVSEPRAVIKELYRYALSKSKKVIAVSDMYLPSDVLRRMLDNCGYTEISNIYVSCEEKSRKSDGALFRKVEKKEACCRGSFFHIGDNYQSDRLMSRQSGWKSLCVPSTLSYFVNSSPRTAYRFLDSNFKSAESRCLLGYVINYAENNHVSGLKFGKPLDIYTFADVYLFPLLYRISGFCAFNKEIQSLYGHIHFIARDGWLPIKAYEAIRKVCGNVCASSYLFGSRLFYYSSDEEILNRARQYYKDVLHTSDNRALVFDIGYNGSVSLGIQNAVHDSKLKVDKVYVWQHPLNATRDREQETRTFLLEGDFPSKGEGIYKDWLIFMECLLCPLVGSVTDVTKERDDYIPHYAEQNFSREMRDAITKMQEESLSVFTSYVNLLGNEYCECFQLPSDSPFLNLTYHYIERDDKRFNDFLDNIIFEDQFLKGKPISLGDMIRRYSQPDWIISIKVTISRILGNLSLRSCF